MLSQGAICLWFYFLALLMNFKVTQTAKKLYLQSTTENSIICKSCLKEVDWWAPSSLRSTGRSLLLDIVKKKLLRRSL